MIWEINYPTAPLGFLLGQVAGNITYEIPRLRSGSVRLINFATQN